MLETSVRAFSAGFLSCLCGPPSFAPQAAAGAPGPAAGRLTVLASPQPRLFSGKRSADPEHQGRMEGGGGPALWKEAAPLCQPSPQPHCVLQRLVIDAASRRLRVKELLFPLTCAGAFERCRAPIRGWFFKPTFSTFQDFEYDKFIKP